MKALLSIEPGPAETLSFADIEPPVPKPGDLLLRVKAVSLNYPDALMLEDLYQTKPPRPFVPGLEVSGVVETVGGEVTGFAPGDKICCMSALGGLSEFATCKSELAAKIPDDMPFDTGAAIMMTYGTSLHALIDRASLKAGDNLLVLGAGGGVGTAAVELGKALGARVVGAVSSPEKRDAVLAAGADEVIIYPRGELDKQASRELASAFKAACPDGYDVIYDPVGGDYCEPALRSIAWEGRYAVIGFTAGIPKLPLNLTLLKCCQVVGVFWGEWVGRNHGLFLNEMEMLFDFWREGKIQPLISEHYAFEDAPKALSKMRNRGAIGKLVVTVEE